MVQTLTHKTHKTDSPFSTTGAHVFRLSDEQYAFYWPSIEQELDKVPHIWQPFFTKEYLRDIPLHQELLVWEAGVKGAMTIVIFAQFIQTPRGNGLSFRLALGNNLDACLPQLEATFEQLARVMGCSFVEVSGREGWLRKLPGFKRDYTVMSKQVDNFMVQ